MENCKDEIEFFNSMIDSSLKERLQSFIDKPFNVLEYTDAIDMLLKAKEEGHKFDNENIFWGMDLQSEHER